MTVVRFFIVGVLNTLVALIIFAALQWAIGDYRVAGFIAVPICVLISHSTMGRLVFNSRGFGTLLPFTLVYGVLGVVNAIIISAVVRFGYDPLLGQLVAAPFVAVLSLFANKQFVFRQVR